MTTDLSARERARQGTTGSRAGRRRPAEPEGWSPRAGHEPSTPSAPAGRRTRSARPSAPSSAPPAAGRTATLTPPRLRPPAVPRPATAPQPPAAARPDARAASRLGVPRTPFVLFVLALIVGGLICLLAVNTTLGTASFQISNLQQGNAQLAQQEQALQQQVARDSVAGTIAHRAYRLGMRQQQQLDFLNARTGHLSRQPALHGVMIVPGYTP